MRSVNSLILRLFVKRNMITVGTVRNVLVFTLLFEVSVKTYFYRWIPPEIHHKDSRATCKIQSKCTRLQRYEDDRDFGIISNLFECLIPLVSVWKGDAVCLDIVAAWGE